MNLSNLGGFRVKSSPTYVTLVTILFHAFLLVFPVLTTRKASCSDTAFTFGKGTSHFPAFSFLFCLIMLERTLARLTLSVEQIGRDGAVFHLLFLLFLVEFLLVHFDGLFHLDLLSVPFFVVNLSLDAPKLLLLGSSLVSFTRLLLPLLLMIVHAVAMPLPMQLYVFVLRHRGLLCCIAMLDLYLCTVF